MDRQVRDALRRLLGSEPDAGLVRRVRAVAPSLKPAEVRASLARLQISIDVPAVTTARPESPEPPRVARRAPASKTPNASKDAAPDGAGTPWRRITLAQLVEAGLLGLPQRLEHRYRGHDLTARIEKADRIVFDGQAYDSVSTAGGMARKSVVGSPPGRDYPQTNGWTFWRYLRADGSLGSLDELRRQLHEGKVVNLETPRRHGA